MSLDAMSWAFRQNLPPAEKLVLLSLADHHNGETAKCIPGQRSIAQQTSMCVRTVQRHLSALERRGLIRRTARFRKEGRGRTSDSYVLLMGGDNVSLYSDQGDSPDTTKATNQDDQGDTGVRARTGREPEGEPVAAAPRKTDELWDTMLSVCGIDPTTLTRTARGQINKALKELREIGATPADLKAKAVAYRKTWPGMSLTPTALVKHWAQLATKTDTKKRTCECGQPLDRHDDEFHNTLLNGGL